MVTENLTKRIKIGALVCAGLSAATAVLILSRWVIQLPQQTTACLNCGVLAPAGGLAMLLVSSALVVTLVWPESLFIRWMSMVETGLATGMSLLEIIQVFPGFYWQPLQPFFRVDGTNGVSVYTTLLFSIFTLLCCLALVSFTFAGEKLVMNRIAAIPALSVNAISSMIVLGAFYRTPVFDAPGIFSPAIGFMALGMGLYLPVVPRMPNTRILLGNSISARLLRFFLPAVMALSVLEEWIRSYIPSANEAVWHFMAGILDMSVIAAIIYLVSKRTGDVLDKDTETLQNSVERYRSLFDNSMAPQWEEDYSAVKVYFDHLRKAGVQDFHSYFGSNPNEVMHCASLVKTLDFNQEVLNFYKVNRREDLPTHISGYFVDETWANYAEVLASLAEGQTRFEGERTISDLQGKERRVLIRSTVVPGHQEDLSRVLLTLFDITGLKQAEAEASSWKQRYDLVTAAAGQIVYDWNPADGSITWSDNTAQVIGYAPTELNLGVDQWAALIDPNDRPETLRKLDESVKNGTPFVAEYGFMHKDGRCLQILDKGFLLQQAQDKTQHMVGIMQDVTERRQIEEGMRKWAHIFEHTELGVSVSSIDGTLLNLVNPAFARMHGYAVEELVGQPIANVYAPLDRQDLGGHIQTTQQQGHHTYESYHLRKDRSVFPAMVDLTAVKDENGKDLYRVAIVQDITERKRVEAVLQESETRYRELFNAIQSGVLVTKASQSGDDFLVTEINQAGEKICKVAKVAVLTTSISNIFPVEKEPGFADVFHRVWQSGASEHFSTTAYSGKNIAYWRENYVYKLASGEVVAIFDDVTERMKTMEALLESQNFVQHIVDTVPSVVFIYDIPEDHLVYSNQHYKELFSFPSEQLNTMGIEGLYNFVHEDDRPALAETVRGLLTAPDNPVVISEFRIGADHTNWLWLRTRIAIFSRDQGGKVTQLLGIVEDITERRMMEEQLKAALQEKEVLLKEIHHRVKNNLQVVNSLLNLRSATIEDVKAQQAFQDCQSNVNAIALVHESIYQSQNLVVIDGTEYISNLVNQLRTAYAWDSSGILLDLHVQPVSLNLDNAIPCGLILTELVTNVAKYAFPAGQFPPDQKKHLWIDFHPEGPQCILQVRDNGVGLKPDFDIKKTTSLGLQLIQLLTQQLKGKLTFVNDHGATFTISFPINQP